MRMANYKRKIEKNQNFSKTCLTGQAIALSSLAYMAIYSLGVYAHTCP